MRLDQLPQGLSAEVLSVEEPEPLRGQALPDPISRRLRELGFVAGEPVRSVARGPFGTEPLLVQVGYTRFALRRSEAARVQVSCAELVAAAARA
jgi:ferrous iron transport protein A